MNRRELLKAIPGIPGIYVNGTLASKVADALPAKQELMGEKVKAKVIARALVMERTHVLQVLTDPGWNPKRGEDPMLKNFSATEKAAQDYICRLVLGILAPELIECPNCRRRPRDHSHAEIMACINAVRSKEVH